MSTYGGWGERNIRLELPQSDPVCPICSTASCVGDGTYDGHIVFEPAPKEDPAATFIIPTRIFREERVGDRVYRKLIYAVGDKVRPDLARELGLLADD